MQFGPLPCLLIGIGSILSLILVFRMHAFFALIISSILVAGLSDAIPIVQVPGLIVWGFLGMVGKIGILLIFAAMIGKCMMDSGAAERIVRSLTRLFGEGRENYSLLTSGFVLSIPVFFDTVFYLLAPLARAVYARKKRDYVFIICCVAAGGAVTHALVPPTPGPILVAEYLGVSIGLTILVGILASIVPVFVGGVAYARWINKRLHVEPKEVMGVTETELEAISQKKDSELPSVFWSYIPFILPVLMISAATLFDLTLKGSAYENLLPLFGYLLHKNTSFALGALIGLYVLIKTTRLPLGQVAEKMTPAVKSGLLIVCITSAGGAFGSALTNAGIGGMIAEAAKEWEIPLILLAYLTATLIRIAQGSATVAMTTTAAIIAAALANMTLTYNPVYLIAVIGFGATGFSWMNDSGFWIVSRMSGLTEKETLKTWTVLLTVLSISGFIWVYLLTKILPLT